MFRRPPCRPSATAVLVGVALVWGAATPGFALPAAAQEPNTETATEIGTETRTETASPWQRAVPATDRPPHIDGWLEPEEWRGAAVIDDLKQVEPREGVEPSEQTYIYLLVDADNLYIALDCREQPEDIIGTQVTRDANLDPDDRVELVIDTFLDRRNAYFFQIGPGSSKGDALVAGNGSVFIKDWDGIWQGRARITATGWTAEMAIPAKTLSMKPGLDAWGFNARRHIKHANEQAQWAYPDRQNRLFNIASAGTLTGLAVLDPGLGLDVVPYLSLKSDRDHADGDDRETLEPGVDLRWKVNPSLTATFTVNTDFAETEVDSRVVNLTRFPVFFPEKRDFFLQDSGIFSFGPDDNDLVPFFSRRVGLSARGEPVPILAGAKLTGRVGAVNLGVLDVATDSFAGIGTKNLAVVRASLNVLEESQLGMLLTAGDPATGGDNALAGLDFTYRIRDFLGSKNLRVGGFVLGTRDEPSHQTGPPPEPVDGHALGVFAEYPNDFLEMELGWREISDDFRPDLGFVRRRGVRQLSGRFEVEPRPAKGPVRSFAFGVQPEISTSLADGETDTATWRLKLVETRFDSGDRIALNLVPTEERLVEPFEIFPGVILPPGRYRFDRWWVEVATADKRPLVGGITYIGGTFFNGTLEELAASLALRPFPGLSVELETEHNDVALREGSFTTSLARLRVTTDFGPDISWINFLQWDNTSETLGWNSRLRWILTPGRDVFFVVNKAFDRRDLLGRLRGFAPATTDVTLKLSYTWRF